MSLPKVLKRCPTARFLDYRADKTFQGQIISILSPERGLFYVINDNDFETFAKVEEHQPLEPLEEPPKFRELFIYRNQRAYRFKTSPCDNQGIRAFLIDVGKEVYVSFDPKQFFKMPPEYNFLPLALFCTLELGYGDHETISDFLKSNIFELFTFKVKRSILVTNALGKNQTCLVLKIDSDVTDVEYGLSMSDDEVKIDTIEYQDSPTMTQDIPKLDPPANGSVIFVFLTSWRNVNTVYGRFLTCDDITAELMTPARDLQLWMNQKNVIECYEEVYGEPEIGEMVLVFDRDDRFKRGLVKSKNDQKSYTIFLVDYGDVLKMEHEELFRFPSRCVTLPFQVARLNIQNLSTIDGLKEYGRLVTPAMAKVIDSTYNNSTLELTVKIYDLKGRQLKN